MDTEAVEIPVCPDLNRLGAFWAGGLAGPEAAACEAHLADCADCRALVAALAEVADRYGDPDGGVPDVVPVAEFPSRRAGPRWAAAAAILVVAAAVAVAALRRDSEGVAAVLEARFSDGAGAQAVSHGAGGAIHAPRGGWLAFADGTEVRLAAGSAAMLVPPGGGERLRLRLARPSRCNAVAF